MSIKKKLQRGFTLVELMIVVAIIGILAVLAIYGVKKYIANAKTAEARQALGRMGKDAAAAYEGERMSPNIIGDGASSAVIRQLCAPEPATVPAAVPAATKYQSVPADWKVGASIAGSAPYGFACLRFELNTPQYYAYGYTSTATTMQASAAGDLDGNGTQSLFLLKGQITEARLKLAPQLEETNPEE